MRLGVLSDSHGRTQRVRQAVEALDAAGVDVLVHCGDVGGPEVLEMLAGRPFWYVLGNTDPIFPAWRPHIEALGIPWPEGPLDLDLAGRKVAVYHGHERDFEQAIRSGRFDYVLHGHTHRQADYRIGPTHVVNPGALHRTNTPSVAVVDLLADRVSFVPLTDPTV